MPCTCKFPRRWRFAKCRQIFQFTVPNSIKISRRVRIRAQNSSSNPFWYETDDLIVVLCARRCTSAPELVRFTVKWTRRGIRRLDSDSATLFSVNQCVEFEKRSKVCESPSAAACTRQLPNFGSGEFAAAMQALELKKIRQYSLSKTKNIQFRRLPLCYQESSEKKRFLP